MGSFGSRDSPQTGHADEVLKSFNLSAPTAAVVGAGIAGVHMAHELARMGFDVTVIEKEESIASGETQFCLPYVGVGLLEPSFVGISWYREMAMGILWPSLCPDLICRDHPFNTFLSRPLYHWLRARRRNTTTGPSVMAYTNNLSRLSHDVIGELAEKYPELQDHILVSPAHVRALRQRGPLVAEAPPGDGRLDLARVDTAHAHPIMIDPVGWTRTLGSICAKKYGVQFAFGERVEGANTYLKYDVETTRTLRLSKKADDLSGKRIGSERSFDVVVLAAGAQTGSLMGHSARLPVIGLTGWCVELRNARGAVGDALHSLFTSLQSVQTMLVALHASSSLYGYAHTAPGQSEQAGVGERVYHISGLLSTDTTVKSGATPVLYHLSRIEKYLRVKCGVELPLVDAYQMGLPAEQDGGKQAQPVTVREYVRAFTPDGVPLIDHVGGTFNTFVCCGFGDHAADFAPGSARILGQLVKLQAEKLLAEDIRLLKDQPVLASSLPRSREEEVLGELHAMMGEGVPSSAPVTSTGLMVKPWAWVCPAWLQSRLIGGISQDTAGGHPKDIPDESTIPKLVNPYSTDRFRGLIPKNVDDVTHRSILRRIGEGEQWVVQAMDPLSRQLNQWAIAYARRDNVPDFIRTIIFYYFNDAPDDLELLKNRMHYQEGMRRLREKYEVSSHSRPSCAANENSGTPRGGQDAPLADGSGRRALSLEDEVRAFYLSTGEHKR